LPIEALLDKVFVVVFLMFLLHKLTNKVDFLELPIGYYSVYLIFDVISTSLLLNDFLLPGVTWGIGLVRLLIAADVVTFADEDLV
jgi:hypothetical protein